MLALPLPFALAMPYKALGVPASVITVAQRLLWVTRQIAISTQIYNAALPARLDGTVWEARHDGLANMLGPAQVDAKRGYYGAYPPAWTASLDNVKEGVVTYPIALNQVDKGEMFSFMLRHEHLLHIAGADPNNMPSDFKDKLMLAWDNCAKATEVDQWL